MHGVTGSGASGPGALAQRRREGFLARGAGLELYHCDWAPVTADGARPPSGALVVALHGYADHCGRYDELADFLVQRGHAVCRFDARGHGKSGGQRGRVDGIAEYVADARAVVELACEQYPGWPLVLFGHSNGGLVAARALQTGAIGQASDAAPSGAPATGIAARGLLSTSPLIELTRRKKAVPDGVARLLSKLAPHVPLPNGIRSEELTHDPARIAAHRADRLVHRCATPRWYWSMTLAGRDALADAPRLTLPMLVLLGDADPIVEPRATQAFFDRAGARDKRLVVRAGEYHEVLNELDRGSAYELIAAWLSRVAAAPG